MKIYRNSQSDSLTPFLPKVRDQSSADLLARFQNKRPDAISIHEKCRWTLNCNVIFVMMANLKIFRKNFQGQYLSSVLQSLPKPDSHNLAFR